MNRRKFIVNSGLLTCGVSFATSDLLARKQQRTKHNASLSDHRIDKVEYVSPNYHYPRLVGRNSKSTHGNRNDGIHGQHHKVNCVKLYTDQGAMG